MLDKSFRRFKSRINLEKICFKHSIRIKNCTLNEDESIDVAGNVWIAFKNLKDIPIKFRNISGDFSCMDNFLTSLKNSPERVGGHFCCQGNKLTSLEGSPRIVVGDFRCHNNNLYSFKGFPESVGGKIFQHGNPVDQIYKLNPCIDFIEMLNDYDVIRDDNKIVETRLRQALEDSGCEKIPEKFWITNYELI